MHRILEIVKNRHFWTVAIMLAICGFFHYFSPQIPLLQQDPFPMTRQAVVRRVRRGKGEQATHARDHAGDHVIESVGVHRRRYPHASWVLPRSTTRVKLRMNATRAQPTDPCLTLRARISISVARASNT